MKITIPLWLFLTLFFIAEVAVIDVLSTIYEAYFMPL